MTIKSIESRPRQGWKLLASKYLFPTAKLTWRHFKTWLKSLYNPIPNPKHDSNSKTKFTN